MNRVPSEKAILDAFVHALDIDTLRRFRTLAKQGKRQAAQQVADSLLDGYGICYIRCPKRGLLAAYVNTGDTYSATLLCNVASGAWRITTWGDFVESFERRNGRKAFESLACY